ncbi:MAG: DinB family protein [Streptosporangiaceae bacterium]|nr:DinB family protein [Streptosporangiaceae bacterium]
MSEQAVHIATQIEQENARLTEFLSGLTAEELRAECGDHAGSTVAAVAVHLADGARQVLQWLDGASGQPGQAPMAGTEPQTHDGHDVSVAEVVELLKQSGAKSAAVVRALTDEQLGSVPPAADGISDGKTPLGEIAATMLAHQAEHVRHMMEAVDQQRRAPI